MMGQEGFGCGSCGGLAAMMFRTGIGDGRLDDGAEFVRLVGMGLGG